MSTFMTTVEIVSHGQSVAVTDEQFEDLQTLGVGWLDYCLSRKTMSHEEALTHLASLALPQPTKQRVQADAAQ
jgi:hypothetical protein